jgi:DNA polymerase-3 subunit gamma/tau
VLFILATTEIHKVPATILSRCQRFDFRRIPSGVIAERLQTITAGEEFTLEPDAAQLIASLADGGMRDAISLLDLVVSTTDHVTAAAVRECAGLVSQEHLFALGEAAEQGDSAAMFAVLERLWGLSVDYQRLCEQLIGYYRNVMVAKSVPDPADLIACLPEELTRYQAVAGALSMERIMECLDVLQNTLIRMSRVSARRTELEMSLLRLCAQKQANATEAAEDASSKNALYARLERLEKQLAAGAVATPAPAKTQRAKPDPTPDSDEIAKTPVELFDRWAKVLEILKVKNGALYGALAESKAYIGGDLLLVDAGELFAKLMREDGYTKQSLREAMLTVTGTKYRLGPYNPAKYEVKEADTKLTDLLIRASELGVDVQVKS